MHVKKGGYAGRTTPGFNGSDPLRRHPAGDESGKKTKKIRAANESLFWFVLDFTAEVVRHFLPLMQVYLALCFEICC